MSNPDLSEKKFVVYYNLLNKAKELLRENYAKRDLYYIRKEIAEYKNSIEELKYEDIAITPKICEQILSYLNISKSNSISKY